MRTFLLFAGSDLLGIRLYTKRSLVELQMDKATTAKPFFRVEVSKQTGQTTAFHSNTTPSGGKVISLRSGAYEAARSAAASALSQHKPGPKK